MHGTNRQIFQKSEKKKKNGMQTGRKDKDEKEEREAKDEMKKEKYERDQRSRQRVAEMKKGCEMPI